MGMQWAFRYTSVTIAVILLFVLVYSLVNVFNYNGFKQDKDLEQPPSMRQSMITSNIVINGIVAVIALILSISVFIDH